MRVFVTGASGWIGSAVVPELLAAGHEVVGLARSDESAAALAAAGVAVRCGGLDDLDVLRAGARDSDGVVHLAFKHDFADFAGAGRTERVAALAMADELVGSGRPLLFASGLAGLAPGRVATEDDPSPFTGPDAPRGGTEAAVLGYADRGVRPVALRFAPSVHGAGDHGFVATLVSVARAAGVSGYVGDGAHRWPAVHRLDVARMVALALEKAPAGSAVHGVGDEGIPTRAIAEAIGAGLGVPAVSVAPEDAAAHFGWIGAFFGMDVAASGERTRRLLGWSPEGPGLLDDLASGVYTAAAVA